MPIVRVVHRIGLGLFAVTAHASGPFQPRDCFTDAEKQAALQFWQQPERYATAPAGEQGHEWCVRMTPAGSAWIREVYRLMTAAKVVPTQDPTGATEEQREWTSWIDRQVQRDWAEAESRATDLNLSGATGGATAADKGHPAKSDPAKYNRKTGTDETGRLTASLTFAGFDDPCPVELVAQVGAPPRFAAPVRPVRHTVTFPDGMVLEYCDNVKVRPKYAYYRFAEGVNSEGESVKSVPSDVMDDLFRAAGLGRTEQKVMKAVSLKEGGFDALNTYDTGYVSVGFIQFACLADGSGSLGAMLRSYKSSNPQSFARDFKAYGIDVLDDAHLVALDLENGEERVGPEAALQVIRDKRLAAVFQRAGKVSQAFRVAQIKAAMAQFYPANDRVNVSLGGTEYTVRVGDVFHSEAGLATLMDRKVNTGKLGGLKEKIEQCASQFGILQPTELPDLEYVLTRALSYREDYLLSASLSRPRDNTVQLSRKGSRTGRKG